MLSENIKNIYNKMAHAAVRAGRNPEDVKLIAVTKGVEAGVIKKASTLGLNEFGENRVQEAEKKVSGLQLQAASGKIRWHLIGHLQKNKARIAVELFDLIQSVDSLELAEAINRHAEKKGKVQRILIQVKLSDEESKYGISKDNVLSLFERIGGLRNLRPEGLMTIPPFFDDPEKVRPYFRELREIRAEAEKEGSGLPELSMGMSNDFEVAIEEGATMVRIGTAIFGERNKKQE